MDTLLNYLNNCIDRQHNLYRKLLDLFIEEQRAILASDLEELNNIVIDKELVLQNIRQEELERKQTGDKIAALLGIDPETLTITQLSTRIKEPYASDIKHRGARLQNLIDEIQVASERNRSLCLHALQFVGSSIKLLTTLTHPNQVYHATGRVQNEGRVGRMLSGAV
jgi:hypothetical protein